MAGSSKRKKKGSRTVSKRTGGSSHRYGPKASEEVEKAMHERKHGELRSGRSGKKVTSREQAIAIGLSKARKKGAKVPKAPASGR